ncbi:hypothetical protein AOQ84DRAFT_229340 [Glonium stellatum]|uniref:Uncharacterized protein n=1 Tax=Glonium stellatum TaxID=574774 RepID=A0A8E2EP52_9PEZI|nr:hypothetical protein AOQ84DRAFT_229340 [Glonium stellatum]
MTTAAVPTGHTSKIIGSRVVVYKRLKTSVSTGATTMHASAQTADTAQASAGRRSSPSVNIILSSAKTNVNYPDEGSVNNKEYGETTSSRKRKYASPGDTMGSGNIEQPVQSLKQLINDEGIDETSSLSEITTDNESQGVMRSQDKPIRAMKKRILANRNLFHPISPNLPAIPSPFVVQIHSTFVKGIDQTEKLKLCLETEKERLVIEHPAPLDWNCQKSISALNSWRTQNLRRITSMRVRALVGPYIFEERQFIAEQMVSTPSPSSRVLAERFNEKFAGKFIGSSTTPRPRRTESSLQSEYTRPENRPCYDAGIVPRAPQENKFGLCERKFLAKAFGRVPRPPLAAITVEFNKRFEGDLVDPFPDLRQARSKRQILQEYKYYKKYYDMGEIAPEVSAPQAKIPPKTLGALEDGDKGSNLILSNIDGSSKGDGSVISSHQGPNAHGDEDSNMSHLG